MFKNYRSLLLSLCLGLSLSTHCYADDPVYQYIRGVLYEVVDVGTDMVGRVRANLKQVDYNVIRTAPIPALTGCVADAGLGVFIGATCCCAAIAGAMFAGQAAVCSDPVRRELYCSGLRNIQAEGLDTMRF